MSGSVVDRMLASRNFWGVCALAVLVFWTFFVLMESEVYNHNLDDPVVNDFVAPWATAHAVVDGVPPASLYDWDKQKELQEAYMGFPFPQEFGWMYPPQVFFFLLPLSLFGYMAAWGLWVAVTCSFFAFVIKRIVGHWSAMPIVLVCPVSLWNVAAGQNGFVSAGLVSVAVFYLSRRPLLAGGALGLLAFKPHLGLLFPLVLIAERRWKTFFAATLTVLALAGASLLAYGVEAWIAFFEGLFEAGGRILVDGGGGYNKLHSIFGCMMLLGLPFLAMPAQVLMALIMVAFVFWIRRHTQNEDMHAAALALAPVFFTPYLWVYDLVLLLVPMAFLLRGAWRSGFLPLEREGLMLVVIFMVLFPTFPLPWGFICAVVVGALIFRRARMVADGAGQDA